METAGNFLEIFFFLSREYKRAWNHTSIYLSISLLSFSFRRVQATTPHVSSYLSISLFFFQVVQETGIPSFAVCLSDFFFQIVQERLASTSRLFLSLSLCFFFLGSTRETGTTLQISLSLYRLSISLPSLLSLFSRCFCGFSSTGHKWKSDTVGKSEKCGLAGSFQDIFWKSG